MTKVDYSCAKVKVVATTLLYGQPGEGSPEVTKEFTCDHVLVSLPLGVLKAAHADIFTPSLGIQKVIMFISP